MRQIAFATLLASISSIASADIFVTATNNDSAAFVLVDADTQITTFSPTPNATIAARRSNTYTAFSFFPNVEVVDVTYESTTGFGDECNFRYTTINGFPQPPIANRSGSARCSARVTGFNFITGDAFVSFTMNN